MGASGSFSFTKLVVPKQGSIKHQNDRIFQKKGVPETNMVEKWCLTYLSLWRFTEIIAYGRT